MSQLLSSPSIVPGFDTDVYLVLDDFGQIGRAYREVDEERADRETIIRNLISGEYNSPVRIVAFNTAEGWSRDVTLEIVKEIQDRWHNGEEISPGLREFIAYELERTKRLATIGSVG